VPINFRAHHRPALQNSQDHIPADNIFVIIAYQMFLCFAGFTRLRKMKKIKASVFPMLFTLPEFLILT
jgi:hypothetical protein